MHHRMCRIFKLLRNENIWIFLSHSDSSIQTLLNAIADISRIVNKDNLRTVMLNKQSSFLRHGIRHNNNCFVSAHRTHKSKTDALIARCGLNDNCILIYKALCLCITNHIVSCSCFYGASDIKPLKFYINIGTIRLNHPIKLYHRGVTDALKHIIINHTLPLVTK